MSLLAGLLVVFLGLIIKSDILIAFGIIAAVIQIILDYMHVRPVKAVAQAAAKPRLKHKLIDAPEDAWKVQEDDILKIMMSGPNPMTIGGSGDILGSQLSGIKDSHGRAAMRNMLPFPNYATKGIPGVMQNVFFGLPFDMAKYIK